MHSAYDSLYDANGNLIKSVNLKLNCFSQKNCIDTMNQTINSIEYMKFENDYFYVESTNEIIKYDLSGKKVSTKTYDGIFDVGLEYSIIYQKSDNSVYLIKNDGSMKKKIDDKKRSCYSLYVNSNNQLTINGKSNCNYSEFLDPELIQYTFDIKTQRFVK